MHRCTIGVVVRERENMQKMKSDLSTNREPVFIGKIIEEELRRQERSVTWLSRKIHCDRRNIYDIFSRACIDTGLLYKLSVALNRDFFKCFSSVLQSAENQENTPPIMLAIELSVSKNNRYNTAFIRFSPSA